MFLQQQNNQPITVDGQEALFIPNSNQGQGQPTIFTPTGQIVRPLQTIQLQSGINKLAIFCSVRRICNDLCF